MLLDDKHIRYAYQVLIPQNTRQGGTRNTPFLNKYTIQICKLATNRTGKTMVTDLPKTATPKATTTQVQR